MDSSQYDNDDDMLNPLAVILVGTLMALLMAGLLGALCIVVSLY